jgi:hypothetical protein
MQGSGSMAPERLNALAEFLAENNWLIGFSVLDQHQRAVRPSRVSRLASQEIVNTRSETWPAP